MPRKHKSTKITASSLGRKNNLGSSILKLASFLFLAFSLTYVVANSLSVQTVKAENEEQGGNEKVNVCHTTDSQENPWNAIEINESALQSHLDHGDFLYEGPVKDNGKPNNGDGQADQWCENNAPEVLGDDCEEGEECDQPEDMCPDMEGIQESVDQCQVPVGNLEFQTLNIIAHKIVCKDESYLPNWGKGGPDVTGTTAENFVAENSPNCWFEPGWQFEWGQENSGNPGNSYTGAAGGVWTAFGPTDENGKAETFVTNVTGSRLEVREVLKEGYIPFSYGANGNNENDYSAEMYCDTDVLNYDNYDWIFNPQFNNTYHCVAFNVQVPEEPVDMCPDMEGIQQSPDECQDVPMCEFGEQTGWYGEYFNYSREHPDMNLPSSEWPDAGHGDPMGTWDTDWYTDAYYRFNQVDTSLTFGEDFFPFDSAPEEIDNGHDYHFGAHWAAKTNVPSTGDYDFTLTSDDDAWVYIDGALADENPGVHPPSTINFTENLTAGPHVFDIFFAERHTVRSHMYFVSNDQLPFVPYNADCPDEPEEICGINKIANGGFEMPIVTQSAKWDIFPSGTPGLGWLVDWMGSVPASFGGFTKPLLANLELQRGVNGWLPQEGSQYAELDSDWNGPASGNLNNEPASTTIYQDIATTPGKTYHVSFWFSPRPGTGSDENALEFNWNNGSFTDNISAVGASNTTWTQYEYDLAASSATTRVRFSDLGTPNSLGTFIDNVDVSLACEEEPIPCEDEISSESLVSDVTTTKDGNPAVPVGAPLHSAWTASIPGATWIWGEHPVSDPVNELTETFVKTFTISGTPLGGTLDIAADNSYSVILNGEELCADTSEFNYSLAGQDACVVPASMLQNGLNTIEFTVKNWAQAGGTQATNPAGLLYKLTFNENSCIPEPQDACPNMEGFQESESECQEEEPVDMCPDMEGIQQSIDECQENEPQDACPEMEGFQGSIEECEEEGPEQPPQINNIQEPIGPRGGGQPHPPGGEQGEVLGEEITDEQLNACGLYLLEYIRHGANNNPEQVIKLQQFLNEQMGANIPLTGFYGPLTMQWLKEFQLKWKDQVLRPWVQAGLYNDENIPTGYVYKTTKRWINILKCPLLNISMPELN